MGLLCMVQIVESVDFIRAAICEQSLATSVDTNCFSMQFNISQIVLASLYYSVIVVLYGRLMLTEICLTSV